MPMLQLLKSQLEQLVASGKGAIDWSAISTAAAAH
jgi:hypothetical protein